MRLPTHVLMMTLAGTIVLGGATTAFAQDTSCTDPWINKAIQAVEGRPAIGAGILGECMPGLYIDATKTTRGNSSFKSYADALKRVTATNKMLRGQRFSFAPAPNYTFAPYRNNNPIFSGCVAAGAGNIIAANSFRRGDKSVTDVFDLPGGRKLVLRETAIDPGKDDKK